MFEKVLIGIFIPFFGTALGSGSVLFMKRQMNLFWQDFLSAVAAGVMTAACVWSLIIPAVEDSAHLGRMAFLPGCIGIVSGVIFMIVLGFISDKLLFSQESGNLRKKDLTVFLSVTIHNIPEGMAVGSVFAAATQNNDYHLTVAALALSLGIAVQNIPEGAIISMPLYAGGMKKLKALLVGALSGIVEPLGAFITLLAAKTVGVLLPYLLTFAAGAMLFVVTQQLIPDIKYKGKIPLIGIAFTLGFMIMMSLDVALS